jgi:hypothetical protein
MDTRDEEEDSVEAMLLAERVSTPTQGKWCSGFTAAKNMADELQVPLIAVWSNGDKCSNCVALIKCMLQPIFKTWMAMSKCIFWFGCATDSSQDDKTNGTGYKWCWKNRSIGLYPFVRVWWFPGKLQVDVAASGDKWTCGRDDELGASKFLANLNKFLATHLDGSCANGECGVPFVGTELESDASMLNPCPEGDCVPPSEDADNKPTEEDTSSESSSELLQRVRYLSEQIEQQDRMIMNLKSAWSKIANDIQQMAAIIEDT